MVVPMRSFSVHRRGHDETSDNLLVSEVDNIVDLAHRSETEKYSRSIPASEAPSIDCLQSKGESASSSRYYGSRC